MGKADRVPEQTIPPVLILDYMLPPDWDTGAWGSALTGSIRRRGRAPTTAPSRAPLACVLACARRRLSHPNRAKTLASQGTNTMDQAAKTVGGRVGRHMAYMAPVVTTMMLS